MNAIETKAAEIKHTGISRVLTEYLEHKLKDYSSKLITTKDNDALRQLQGRAQELTELISFFKV